MYLKVSKSKTNIKIHKTSNKVLSYKRSYANWLRPLVQMRLSLFLLLILILIPSIHLWVYVKVGVLLVGVRWPKSRASSRFLWDVRCGENIINSHEEQTSFVPLFFFMALFSLCLFPTCTFFICCIPFYPSALFMKQRWSIDVGTTMPIVNG